MSSDEIKQQKEVEFYASSVTAWYNTSLEHDKSILTLAAGGIGLLITLLTTVGPTSAEAFVLYVGAIISFLVTIIAVLLVFRGNKTYVTKVLAGGSDEDMPFLAVADSVALWAFGIGVVFTTVIGISAAIHSYTLKSKKMANEPAQQAQPTQPARLCESSPNAGNSQPVFVIESFNGVRDLQKSFSGASALQSRSTAKAPAPVPAASAAPPDSSGTNQPCNNSK